MAIYYENQQELIVLYIVLRLKHIFKYATYRN